MRDGLDTPNPRSATDGQLEETNVPSAVSDAGVSRSGRRRPRSTYRDLTSGSIPKSLAHLAWPQAAEGVLNVAYQMVDLIWAGRLPAGIQAIAGVGVGQTFTQLGFMARQGLDNVTRAMISRAVGAGDIQLANHIAVQSFSLTVLYSLLMIAFGLLLTDVLMRAVGVSQEVHSETAMYMRLQFFMVAAMSFRMVAAAALQASGDVISPLKATTVTRLAHILISPFLMFGWWWFPSWGLAGAGVAGLLSQVLGAGMNLHVLFRGNSQLSLTLRDYYVDYPLLWRMIKIGAPASVAGSERAVAQIVLLGVVAPFGVVAMAAYALTRRMEMLANFGSMGIGQASGIMVGQNLGAGRPDRARQSVGWALLYVTCVKTFIGGIIIAFPMLFITVFTSQADVVELASVWLRIQVIAAIFMGMQMVFQQSFNTAGDTLAPMIVTLVAVWAVEVPLAWFLSYGLGVGPVGVGYAAIAAMASRLLMYVPYFYWGRWLRVKVI
jgi:putative MATE family efflux protein